MMQGTQKFRRVQAAGVVWLFVLPYMLFDVYRPFEGVPARLYIALEERTTWKVLAEYY